MFIKELNSDRRFLSCDRSRQRVKKTLKQVWHGPVPRSKTIVNKKLQKSRKLEKNLKFNDFKQKSETLARFHSNATIMII